MSEWPDEIKRCRPKAPEGYDSLLPEGYEWVRGTVGDAITQEGFYAYHNTTGECYVAKPKVKKYDWSKTGPNTLVKGPSGSKYHYREVKKHMSGYVLHTDCFQVHIAGQPCPVDDENTIVQLLEDDKPYVAKYIDWAYTRIFKVVGLVENCEYP